MKPASSASRRDFLRASVLTTAIFGARSVQAEDETRKAGENSGKARNVIFMVSDGMNLGALSLARQYHLLANNKLTHWMKMYQERPMVRCLVDTSSASSMVTDSAAAASAWGSGKRVKNGTINIDPENDAPLKPINVNLQAAGRKVGLVSTATITHATPAGFAANVPNRGSEEEIAKQYLERKVDVLLGGGQKFFSPELRQQYQTAGYDFVETRDALAKLSNDALKPVLGLFSKSYIPFSIDRNNVPEIAATVPTLAEMSQVALDRLKHAANGFFLMIEGARIDHAGHANDAAASIHDQLAFEDAIATVLAFVDKNPDTLLVITTDHGCGGIQMNGVSADPKQGFAPGLYNASTSYFLRLRNFQRSSEWMKQNGVEGLNGPKLGEAFKQYTGLTLTEDQIKSAQGLKNYGKIVDAHTGVGWTGGNHTGDLVEFCAYGPGSHHFSPFMLNSDVHDRLLRAMDMAPA